MDTVGNAEAAHVCVKAGAKRVADANRRIICKELRNGVRLDPEPVEAFDWGTAPRPIANPR